MKNLQMFCLTLDPAHYDFIKSLNYVPVGLGKKEFSRDWFTDSTGKNISHKNEYYGEYTFHYWLWKNYIDKLDDKWIGFCQYRKFWTLNNYDNTKITFQELPSLVLKNIPPEYEDYEAILSQPFFVNKKKIMKFIKKGFKIILKKPQYIFDSNSRNIKFHFDIMHGENNLNKAIDLLDEENKKDFEIYVNSKLYFHAQNMFICKSKNLLKKYYETVFPWLEKCEKVFGFQKLRGYDLTRIYGFLAERFLSYWFQKNAKCKTMNIAFYDIRNDIN